MSERVMETMVQAVVDEAAGKMAQYMFCSGTFLEILQDTVDPWRRELKRARRQLAKIGA